MRRNGDQRAARASEPAKRLPQEIAAKLRERILRGEIEVGERLPPERDLAPSLCTNRNTLREAMRTLEAEGLVRARQGDGVRVLDFRRTAHLGLLPHFFRVASEGEQARILGDLLRFRAALALEIVELAAARATDADIAAIHGKVEHLAAVIEKNEPRLIGESELDLYRIATEASRSVAAVWVLNGLEPVVRHLLHIAPELWLIADGYVDSWREIATAIAAREGERAKDALTHLMDRGDRRLLSLLDLAADPNTIAEPEGS